MVSVYVDEHDAANKVCPAEHLFPVSEDTQLADVVWRNIRISSNALGVHLFYFGKVCCRGVLAHYRSQRLTI